MNRKLKELVRRYLPRSVRGYSVITGPLRGSRIVTSMHDYPGAILGTTETALLRWIEHNVGPGETWLDVGAHYGYVAIALCKAVGHTGQIFAFEPALSTASSLLETKELNRLPQLNVIPLALGEESAVKLQTLSSVRGMVDKTAQSATTLTFLVAGFDSLWRSLAGSARIDGIKIDVQGSEFSALKGMAQSLATWRPTLIIEFHEGVDRQEILELLSRVGYSRTCVSIETGAAVSATELMDNESYVFRREGDGQ